MVTFFKTQLTKVGRLKLVSNPFALPQIHLFYNCLNDIIYIMFERFQEVEVNQGGSLEWLSITSLKVKFDR